ncbi:histone deacetylase [Desulfogranum marinum]|uniref:histone deacetylase family protein n=1 Tax=Desulfogranum marinum TaxID=453220 RepID=UPI0029C86E31|nr:histone deacetylase [Desulfogranum marinum]
MNKPGIVFDTRYLDHRITQPTRENPDRLRSLFGAVKQQFNNRLETVQPREARLEDIEQIHSNFYLNQIREHAIKGDPFSYDKDTYLMELSLATAQLAAGGCLELADQIMGGSLEQGFALIRPPGHHAEPGRGMGFCILNNIAITAQYLQDHFQLDRILVIDFDVHHGNGTQEAFYDSDKVLFISIHQNNIFPFSGDIAEIGNAEGLGYNINIPVHSHFGDQEYTFLLGKLLQSVAEQYLPEIILVSAGYDGHREDSISSTFLSTHSFHTITTLLRQCARDICDDRLLFILEGGYNPVSLEKSVLATIDSLLQPHGSRVGILHSERADALFTNHPLHAFWTL